MRFLTGAPSYTFTLSDYSSSEIWSTIQTSDSANLIMTAGTPCSGGSDSSTNAIGLALSHAYSVIGVANVLNSDGTVYA